MHEMFTLTSEQRDTVINYLGVYAAAQTFTPSLDLLNHLLFAYSQRVPWESASRIARRAQLATPEVCARSAWQFWSDAMQSGTGATCFETNAGFIALLRALGFEGYLTINDMHETIGCHTAAVISLNGQRYLTDAGMPVYGPLLLDPNHETHVATPVMNFTATPAGANRFEITRAPHPRPYVYTLIDTPVSETAYRDATISDYGDNGLFLDQLVINKVVDGQLWRFSSTERPYRVEHFADGKRIDTPLLASVSNITDIGITDIVDAEVPLKDITAALHARFGIAISVLNAALTTLETLPATR